jgi:putative tricarboxylic transport membrane protein
MTSMQSVSILAAFMRMRAALALAVLAAGLPGAAHAQATWTPEKNVELVVGAGAGAAADATARQIQRIMQERKLIPVTASVINKPGGSYALSWIYINQHAKDGHYLSITTLALLTNALTGSNPLTYTDVTPIAQLFTDYVVIAVRADSPIKTGKDLVVKLKPNPAAASIGIAASLGNQNHIAAALALKAGGVDVKKLKIVVFDSSANSVISVLGGHVDVVAATALNVTPHLQTGKLRAIAVSSPKRLSGAMAAVPTWTEQGYNAVFGNWRGVVGPRGLSPAQVAYWESVFARLVKTDEWRQEMEQNFWSDFYLNSRDTQAVLQKENATLKNILGDLGLAK